MLLALSTETVERRDRAEFALFSVVVNDRQIVDVKHSQTRDERLVIVISSSHR